MSKGLVKRNPKPVERMTPLELFRFDLRELTKQYQTEQRHYKQAREELEEKLPGIQKELQRKKRIKARMVKDFLKLNNEIKEEERQGLEATNISKNDVLEGRKPAYEHAKIGLNKIEIERRAGKAANKKLSEMHAMIEEIDLEIKKLKRKELSLMLEIRFCYRAPAVNLIEKTKAKIGVQEAKITDLDHGTPKMRQDLRDVEDVIKNFEADTLIFGKSYWGLDEKAVKDLYFSVEIPKRFKAALWEIHMEIQGSKKKITLKLDTGFGIRDPGLSWFYENQ